MPRHPVYLGSSSGNNNNLNKKKRIEGRSQDIKVSGTTSTTGLHLPGDAQPSDGESGRAQETPCFLQRLGCHQEPVP